MPRFKWDKTCKHASYTEPQYYDFTNNDLTIMKARNLGAIFNVQATPAISSKMGSFSLCIRIDIAGSDDKWNAIGLIDTSKRRHLRQKGGGGCCVQLMTGNIFVDGKDTKESIGKIVTGSVVMITYVPSDKKVYFRSSTSKKEASVAYFSASVRPSAAMRAAWKMTIVPPFEWSKSISIKNTKPSLYTLSRNGLTAKKEKQPASIYNIVATCKVAPQPRKAFAFWVKILKYPKSDDYDAIGFIGSSHPHLRTKGGVCVQLKTGKIYMSSRGGKSEPYASLSRPIRVGDILKCAKHGNSITFVLNDDSRVIFTATGQFPDDVYPAAAFRNKDCEVTFETLDASAASTVPAATPIAAIPLTPNLSGFSWDTSKNTPSARANSYQVSGSGVAMKASNPALIFNIEGTPYKSSPFQFSVHVKNSTSSPQYHDYAAVGLHAVNDGHLRKKNGCCVALSTGTIYTEGQARGVGVGRIIPGDTVYVQFSAGKIVKFRKKRGGMFTGPPIGVTWPQLTSGVVPAAAARYIGWSFQLGAASATDFVRGGSGASKISSGIAPVPPPPATAVKYKWQFEDGTKGSGSWKDYIPADQKTLESNFAAKVSNFVLTNRWGAYEVSGLLSATPTQKSKKTGWVRPMRRVPLSGPVPTPVLPKPTPVPVTTTPMKWQFENGTAGSANWTDYLPGDSLKLEAAFKAGQTTLSITNKFGTYLINGLTSSAPTQKNTSTNAVRRLRRVPMSTAGPTPTTTTTTPTPTPIRVVSDPPPLPPHLQKLKTVKQQSKEDIGKLGQMFVTMMTTGAGPDFWDPFPAGNKTGSMLVTLNPSSVEYRDALRHFRKTCSKQMIKIERVQNRYLWQEYLSTKMSMCAKNNGIVNERVLFHGTRSAKPEFIWKGKNASGFDPRLGKGYYGIGAYFALKASYSVRGYSYNCGNGARQVFLATVLCGDTKIYGSKKDQSLKRAPDLPSGHPHAPGLYDSVEGGPHDGSKMYIVYEGSQAYPLYLYTYKY